MIAPDNYPAVKETVLAESAYRSELLQLYLKLIDLPFPVLITPSIRVGSWMD